ncbi:DNA-directed RNA polymerase core subunit rpc10 [Coemansia sp. Benny D115]|nr:DNA-directed RNA polymerase core subunit rpc10 [Coemansia sp. Benny D115]
MEYATQIGSVNPAISMRPQLQQLSYLCARCAKPNEIKPKEPIRCHECGHRILYKKRTDRMPARRSRTRWREISVFDK